MKVLMVAVDANRGGAPKSMLEMIYNLKKTYGVEFVLLIPKEGALSQLCRDNGIQYLIDGHVKIARAKGSTAFRRFVKMMLLPLYIIKCHFCNWRALKIIEKNIDIDSIDIIHTNSNRDGIGALLAKKYNKKHIWHIREYGKEDYDVFFVPPFNVQFMNDTTTAFVLISQALQKTWVERGLDINKCHQIYNGIDINQIKYSERIPEELSSKIRMVFTGTICPAKGQLEIIEALSLLKDEEKKRIKLDFIGDGPIEYINKIQRKIRRYNLVDNVSFKGYCNNVGNLLKDYDVGVVCSKAEAFGRITPEYLAAGLIVIASNTGANPELIIDGRTGFLYQKNDYHDLANCIKKICKMSQKEFTLMRSNAHWEAENKYTAELNAQKIYELYQNILVQE